jgi:hypothetical protein
MSSLDVKYGLARAGIACLAPFASCRLRHHHCRKSPFLHLHILSDASRMEYTGKFHIFSICTVYGSCIKSYFLLCPLCLFTSTGNTNHLRTCMYFQQRIALVQCSPFHRTVPIYGNTLAQRLQFIVEDSLLLNTSTSASSSSP